METTAAARKADLVMLDTQPAKGVIERRCVRAQNFFVEWLAAGAGAPALEISSDGEIMLLTFDARAKIARAGDVTMIGQRTLAVLPSGACEIAFEAGSACILSTRQLAATPPLNAASYVASDKRVAPVGPAWRRTGNPNQIQVFDIDRVKAPADNPRLKMFQSATMSINWVDYEGPRDRTKLSPHAHADLEQASLAVAGSFVHHTRVAWGSNANEWSDDRHLPAGSPSVVVIPPDIIHTTEGVGPGHHLLIDIFAPPRRDFIARNWVLNSQEYAAPHAVG